MTSHVFDHLKHITYQLGEGILKPDDQNIILWTDITQKKICEFNFDTLRYTESQFPGNSFTSPSAIFETENPNQYLVASGTSIHLWNKIINQIIDTIQHPDLDQIQTRFNDGKLDPNGKLFIGTLDLFDRPNKSALYRLDIPDSTIQTDLTNQTDSTIQTDQQIRPLSGARLTKVLDNISLSNGLGWSNDATKFYYIDTPTRELKIYNYDPSTATIDNSNYIQIDLKSYEGVPDGLTIHPITNHIFIAMWGGSQILEIELGQPIKSHPISAKYPTNLSFLSDHKALITTANHDNISDTNDGKIHFLTLARTNLTHQN